MSPQRVLVIRFSSIGDIVLLTPLFRELKKQFPKVEIDFLTSTDFASICKNNPHLRQVIALNRKEGKSAFEKVVSICKENQYDLVLDAHASLRSRHLMWKLWGMFPSREKFKRIDKRSWKRNLLLLTKVNFLKNFPSQREAYCQLLADFVPLSSLNLSTELFPGKEEKEKVDTLIKKSSLNLSKTIVVGPSASFPGKGWPKEHYLELILKLQQQNYEIALLGGGNDLETFWLEEKGREQKKGKLVNFAGKLSFLDSSELLQRCSLAIVNDSAIVHFAEAMGTPAISIFGPTVKEFGYGPFLPNSYLMEVDLPCRPCSRNGKGDCKNKVQRECLTRISVERVLEKATSILEKERAN